MPPASVCFGRWCVAALSRCHSSECSGKRNSGHLSALNQTGTTTPVHRPRACAVNHAIGTGRGSRQCSLSVDSQTVTIAAHIALGLLVLAASFLVTLWLTGQL
jgi:hypothetical protein